MLPFVGSISAFVIFIFINAGQLTLTADGGSNSLSPYVLSFIGIVSGLLSERAYMRISEIGTKCFSAKNEWEPSTGEGAKPALQPDSTETAVERADGETPKGSA